MSNERCLHEVLRTAVFTTVQISLARRKNLMAEGYKQKPEKDPTLLPI
jgi:hypothetical protein